MANRTFNQFGGTLERKVIKLFAKISYADPGTGVVPTLVLSEVLNSSTSPVTINPSQGFVSLTPGATGLFTLTLGANNGGVPTYDPYVRLLNVSTSQVGVASITSTGALVTTLVVTDNVNGASGNPSIALQTVVTGAGGPEDNVPANGSTLLVEITLSNTTAY